MSKAPSMPIKRKWCPETCARPIFMDEQDNWRVWDGYGWHIFRIKVPNYCSECGTKRPTNPFDQMPKPPVSMSEEDQLST